MENEYLCRMCSVVSSLVTSLDFQPSRCATMLCHFGHTRKVYIATRFTLLSSTAESSFTSSYVVVPERSGKREVRAAKNVERIKIKLSFFRSQQWIYSMQYVTTCIQEISSVYINFVLYFAFVIRCFFSNFLIWKTSLIFVYGNIYRVGAGITTWCPFLTDWIRTFSVGRSKRRGP